MSTTKKTPAGTPRNHVLVALRKRYGNTTTAMKDRRTPRGGARNHQKDYREERY